MRIYRDPAEREWVAWRQVCLQLDRFGIDINGNHAVAAALKLWGEELVELQIVDQKDSEFHDKELSHARAKYEPFWIDKV